MITLMNISKVNEVRNLNLIKSELSDRFIKGSTQDSDNVTGKVKD